MEKVDIDNALKLLLQQMTTKPEVTPYFYQYFTDGGGGDVSSNFGGSGDGGTWYFGVWNMMVGKSAIVTFNILNLLDLSSARIDFDNVAGNESMNITDLVFCGKPQPVNNNYTTLISFVGYRLKF